MAGGALGQAVVEILADVENFDDDVRAQLEASAREAGAAVEREFDNINREARAAGQRLASNIGDGADRASAAVERMAGLTGQAAQAFNELDADELARIAAEAAKSQTEMARLARSARDASGEFRRGFSPEQLRDIERSATEAAAEMARLQAQATEARRVLNEFSPAEVRRLAEAAQDAADRLAFVNASRFGRVQRSAQEAGRAILAAFRVGGAEAERALSKINNENFRKVTAAAIKSALVIREAFKRATKDVDFSDAANRGGRALRSLLAAGVGIAALGLRMASLAAAVVAVGAALAPTAGILAGLPATLGLLVGAVATLKVGLIGVGDAFSAAASGDSKAFDAALKKLAPSAAKVATEVKNIKPQLDGLRKSVQGALFKPLIGELTAVTKNLAGPLRAGMTATAGQFGRLGASVTAFGKSGQAVGLVRGLFATLSKQISGIKSGTITGLLQSVARFTTSTLPGFAKAGSSIDSLLKRLTAFLNKAATGGKALEWLQAGKVAFGQLGGILGDVGGIVGTVFKAIGDAGGGTLEQFHEITGSVNDLVGAAGKAGSLTAIFKAINQTALAAAPATAALAKGLASIAPTVQQLSTKLGPILTQAISGLVPAVQGVLTGLLPVFDQLGAAVAKLATGGGLTSFGQSVGDLLAALAPLLPAIASIVNSGLAILGPALSALAPVLGVVARALAAVASSPVAPYLGLLAAQFGVVLAITGSAGTALRSLGPTLKLTGTLLRLMGQAVLFLGRALVSAIIANPVVAAVVAIIAVLVIAYLKVKVFRDIVNAIGSALLTAGKAILGFGKSLVDAFKSGGISGLISKIGSSLGNLGGLIGSGLSKLGPIVASGIKTAFSATVRFFTGLPGQIGSALVTFGPTILAAIGRGLLTVLTFVGTWYLKFLKFYITLPIKIGAALIKFGPAILAAIGSGLLSVLAFVGSWVVKFLVFFLTLPVKIATAILQFGPTVLGAIASGLGAVLLFVAQFVVKVLAFFITLPLRILSALLSLAIILKQPFITGITAVISFLGTAISAVINFFVALPGRIISALAALPGLLASAARTAWNFFTTTSISAGNAIIGFARSLPGRIVAGVRALAGFLRSAAVSGWNAFRSATVSGISAAISFVRTLPGKVLSALSSFASRMVQLGKDVIQGFINGVKSLISTAVSSVTGPLGDIASKVKSLVGSNSPSKVFHAIGGDVMQGFINGSSAKAKAANAVFRKLVGNIIDITKRGFITNLTSTGAKAASTIEKLVKAIQKAFKGKKTSVDNQLVAFLDSQNKSIQNLIKKRDALTETLKKANEFAGQVTSDAKSFAGLGSVQAGANGTLSAADVDKQLQDRLKSINKFQADLSALAKRGLNKSSIAQLVGEGVDRGGALAAALAAGTSTTLNSINATQKAIDKSATALGKTSADLLFDSGTQAGKGFLAGLKSQQEAIRKLMVDIAKSAADAVRKTLKIKSPSRIMEGLGAFTIEGFLAGIAGLAPEIADALSAAVRIRDDIARKLEKQVTAGAVVPTGSNAPGSGSALTAPRDATASLAAIAVALDRLATAQTSGALRSTEVHAPITVNLPVADPDAAAAIVGRRITNLANR